MLHDSKETELESSYQETSPSAGKIAGEVLVPCGARRCDPTTFCGGIDIS